MRSCAWLSALVTLVFVAAIVGILAALCESGGPQRRDRRRVAAGPGRDLTYRGLRAQRDSMQVHSPHPRTRPESRCTILTRFREEETKLNGASAAATALAQNDTERAALADYRALVEGPRGWNRRNTDALALRAAGRYREAQNTFLVNTTQPMVDAAERYRTDITDLIDARTAEVARLTTFANVLGIGLCFGALLFGFAVATVFSRSISRSVGATTRAIASIVSEDIAAVTLMLRRLAAGDLTGRFNSNRQRLPQTGDDEIGTLIRTYNALASGLSEMAGSIRPPPSTCAG